MVLRQSHAQGYQGVEGEFGQINHFLPIDQKIKINYPWAVFTDYFFPQLFFHFLQLSKEIEGREVAGELGGSIVKVRLVGKAIGLGFIQFGDFGDFGEVSSFFQGLLESGGWIPEVSPKPQIDLSVQLLHGWRKAQACLHSGAY